MLKKADVKVWVRDRLSGHLVPRWVFWVKSEEGYPKTASGKIQKFKLREMGVRWLEEASERGKKVEHAVGAGG